MRLPAAPALRLPSLLLPALLLTAGCSSESGFPLRLSSRPLERTDDEKAMFGPVRMRLNPVFTQIKDWSGSNLPEGIEAELEFQDQFGDPTKASGRVTFELYHYHEHDAQPRGERVLNPWVGSIVTAEEQRLRWNRTSRTYSFQLRAPGLSLQRGYLLEAQFEHVGGRRFFSRVIFPALPPDLKGPKPILPGGPLGAPTTDPATAPASAPAAAPAGDSAPP